MAMRAVGVAAVIIGGLVAYLSVMTILPSAIVIGNDTVIPRILITVGFAAFVYFLVSRRSRRHASTAPV